MPTPAPKRLLIMDDHAGMRELFKFHMEKAGFKVEEAEDGLGGLVKAKSFKPDLIVLDLMMPRLNGIETLRRLKTEEFSHIPVIVITAFSETFNEQEIRKEFKIVDYLKKPLKYTELVDLIWRILRPAK